IVVPYRQLRLQTADKFSDLGLVRKLGLVGPEVLNPIVGIIKRRPKSKRSLDIFKTCNIIITNISNLAQGTALEFTEDIANSCSHLFIDEAHHVAAKTWSAFRDAFEGKPTLQFTATP